MSVAPCSTRTGGVATMRPRVTGDVDEAMRLRLVAFEVVVDDAIRPRLADVVDAEVDALVMGALIAAARFGTVVVVLVTGEVLLMVPTGVPSEPAGMLIGAPPVDTVGLLVTSGAVPKVAAGACELTTFADVALEVLGLTTRFPFTVRALPFAGTAAAVTLGREAVVTAGVSVPLLVFENVVPLVVEPTATDDPTPGPAANAPGVTETAEAEAFVGVVRAPAVPIVGALAVEPFATVPPATGTPTKSSSPVTTGVGGELMEEFTVL